MPSDGKQTHTILNLSKVNAILLQTARAKVMNLKSLGLDANNYGETLVPGLMSKLPEEMK